MASAQYLNLRLFLEGVEVPVIGASVTSSVGAPAQATIQVVGDPAVLRLAPRTLVHLFVYDPHGVSKVNPKSADAKYVLLFSGDLMEVQYQKSSATRNATLVCVDDTSYYDLAYTYFYTQAAIESTNIQELTRERAAFVGAKTGRTDVASASLVLGDMLNTVFRDPVPRTSGLKDLKGLLGAIIRILEEFMGVDDVSAGGVNQFFSMHSRRKRLLQQIGMLDDDRIAIKLLSSEFIINFIKKKSDQLGDLVTARQLVKYILDFMYYNLVPISSPRYIASSSIKVTTKPPKSQRLMEATLDRILHRVSLGDRIDYIASEEYAVATFQGDPLSASVIPELDKDVAKFKELSAQPEYAAEVVLLEQFMQELVLYAISAKGGVDTSAAYARLNAIADFIKAIEVPQIQTFSRDASIDDRMYTTCILPDLFFGVAPTCNVLYPDMYSSFTYSRSMATEPTRMHLSTGIEGSLLGNTGADNLTYYAPSINEFKSIQSMSVRSAQVDEDNTALNLVEGRLFDHELYTGIIPTFSRVDRMAYTAALAKANREKVREHLQQQREAAGGGRARTGSLDANLLAGSFESEGAFEEDERDDFFIRVANYQYIKKKLGKRRGGASGLLNPYAVPGFPMIIIDGVPVDGAGDVFKDFSEADDQNESYVGLLTSVTHSVSQQASGSTSYELAYVRPHRNRDDEFLSELSTLERLDTSSAEVVDVNVVEALRNFTNTTTIESIPLERLETLTRLLNIALLCTNSVGESAVTKVSTTTVASIKVPKFPNLSRGETVLGKRVLAVEVIDSNQAGLSVDALGNTFAEQESTISAEDAERYVQRLSVSNPLIGASLDAETRVRASKLLSTRPAEITVDDLRALCALSVNGTKRVALPAFAKIRVYFVGDKEDTTGFLPIEEAIRPRYIDDSYSSPYIGKLVYKKLLGVGSVVDSVDQLADKVNAPKAKFSASPGQLGNPSQAEALKEVVSQEVAIDLMSYAYATRGRSADYSFRKVRREIASIPDVIGEGGFHYNAYASSNADKPLSLIQDLVYDRDTKRCPDGYRKATPQEVEEILSRVNPKLDVRESRSKLVSAYVSGLRSKGKLG